MKTKILEKIILFTAVLAAAAMFSCKDEEVFTVPEQLFSRWTKAIETLNYNKYKYSEAYPESEKVFREIYRVTYYNNCIVKELGDFDRDDVKKDHQGNEYMWRKIWFQCSEINRKGNRQTGTVRGDVECVKFKTGERKEDGWLLWNRTMIRTDQ